MAESQRDIKESYKQLERVGGRAGTDTIRLWEGYREQAHLWRALSLIQFPATVMAIAIALIMYYFADTIITVPHAPQPGHYSLTQLPDSEFINAATTVINLIANYQPAIARRQFKTARKYLWEPALTQFEEVMMGSELSSIERTKRSQLFFINPRLIRVERAPQFDAVVVRVQGLRQRLIGNRPIAVQEMQYLVKMTTIPRNVHNEHGIVITDIRLRLISEREAGKEDEKEARSDKRAAKEASRRR